MIGLGSIPIFINLLLKPDQLLAYIPQDSFMNFIVYKDYSYQVLFSAICLTVFFIFKKINKKENKAIEIFKEITETLGREADE